MGNRYSSNSRQKNKREDKSSGGGFPFWIFICFITLIFYFWGKVRVDLSIHENHQLKLEKRRMQNEVNDLRAQVQELMSYQRIVDLAEKQGLVVLSADNQDNLPVKMKGLSSEYKDTATRLQYAGLAPIRIKK